MGVTDVPCPTCDARAGQPCEPSKPPGIRAGGDVHPSRAGAWGRHILAESDPRGALANACPYCYAPPGAHCRVVAGDPVCSPDSVHVERHGRQAMPKREPPTPAPKMLTHAAASTFTGLLPLCGCGAAEVQLSDDPARVDCVECIHLRLRRAGVQWTPGPIVEAPPVLRRRPAAEVAAYFDGALAALHFVKGRASSVDGLRVVDVDGMIALFESARVTS